MYRCADFVIVTIGIIVILQHAVATTTPMTTTTISETETTATPETTTQAITSTAQTTTTPETTTTMPLTTTATTPMETTTTTPTTTTPATTTPITPGHAWVWETHNGIETEIVPHKTWSDGRDKCASQGALIAAPVTTDLIDVVVQAAAPIYPSYYWSGFKKTPGATTIENAFYRTNSTTVTWRVGHTFADSGDCIAMEVLYVGVRFYPMDCSASLDVFCYKPGNNLISSLYNSTEYNTTSPLTPSNQYPNATSESCHTRCVSNSNCKAFNFDALTTTCQIFSEADLIPTHLPPPTIDPSCVSSNDTTCMQTYSYNLQYQKGCIPLDVAPSNGSVFSTVTYECTNNFEVANPGQVQCGGDLKWNSLPDCELLGPACPLGWEQHEGYCYLFDMLERTFDDGVDFCATHNAFPLYIQSYSESRYLDDLLYIYNNQNISFWTGGSNREESTHLRWSHEYSSMDYKRFEGYGKWWSPPEKQCVSLSKSKKKDKYYFRSTPCNNTFPVICKMGRIPVGGSYCDDSSWCRGKANCNKYGWGWPYCYCRNVYTQFGANEDQMAYCDYAWSNVDGKDVINLGVPVPRAVAAGACKKVGGSILTAVTKDMETFLMDNYYLPGIGRSYWTGLWQNTNGNFSWTGESLYEFKAIENLPWRWMPDNVIGGYEQTDLCVYQSITALGLRLVGSYCYSLRHTLCIKPDYTRFTNTDNSLLTPYSTIPEIDTSEACLLECLYDSSCLSMTYNIPHMTCDLFDQHSSGTNGDVNTIQRTYIACTPFTDVWNGSHTTGLTTVLSGSVSYGCDTGFHIVSPYADHAVCLQNGRWSQIPICVNELPRCPNGWEQNGVLCYYLGWSQLTWAQANLACFGRGMGSALLYIRSDEEMAYLTDLLDISSTESYWTGGNDIMVNNWYTWTPDDISYIEYYKWFPGLNNGTGTNTSYYVEPSGVAYGYEYVIVENCIQLQRTFDEIDVGEVWYSDASCTREQPYVCKISVLNVGEKNCSLYTTESCKLNSTCINDTCICNEGYFQVGPDNDPATTCSLILPVQSPYSCQGIDDLCVNNSVCVGVQCTCPPDTHMNGIANSYATTCDEGTVKCPNLWTHYENKCYSVKNWVRTTYILKYPMICGGEKSDLVKIETSEENNFVTTLGIGKRVGKLIGLYSRPAEGFVWLDYTEPTFTNYYSSSFANSSVAVLHAYVNPMGYWQLVQENQVGSAANPMLKAPLVVCERATMCPFLPYVEHASYQNITYDTGHTYTYVCEQGYILADDIDSEVICQYEDGQWSSIPSCISLHGSVYESGPPVNYGILMERTTASNISCLLNCTESLICQGYAYEDGKSVCSLYSNVTTVFDPALHQFPEPPDDETWIKNECVAPPTVQYAVKNSTGRSFGSTVKYTCEIGYRIQRGMSDTLNCQSNGHWYPESPNCIARFKQDDLVISEAAGYLKMYEIAYSQTDCENLCITEKSFRCMMAQFHRGTCLLYDKLVSDFARHSYINPTVTQPGTWLSELIDSDLEEFDFYYKLDVSLTSLAEFDLSRELCAKECLAMTGCTAFVYNYNNTGGMNFGICKLHNIASPSTNTEFRDFYELYYIKTGCDPLPVTPGMALDVELQQVAGHDTFGDRYTARCLNFGEAIINGHSGEIECLKTKKWSPLPVCKNLCETGWYMLNKTCYAIDPTPLPFWDAFRQCRSLNSGLVNFYSPEEKQNLVDVWNYTGFAGSTFWIGLYWDVWSWKWSERLSGPPFDIFPDLASDMVGKAVIMDMTTNVTAYEDISMPKNFLCKKAAGNLKCPDTWRNYNGKCVKLHTTVLNFLDAQASCESMKAALISIHSLNDREIIQGLVKEAGVGDTYTGNYKPYREQFKWVDGSRLDYYYYQNKEYYDDLGCSIATKTGISFGGGTYCNTARPYICHIPIDAIGVPTNFSHLPCSTDDFCADNRFHCVGFELSGVFYPPECRPKDCPPPWKFIDEKCYRFSEDESLSFPDAIDRCGRYGGQLFSPIQIWEHHLLYSHHPATYHIGLSSTVLFHDTTTLWLTNRQQNTYSFYRGLVTANDCVYVVPAYLSMVWGGTDACETRRKFICEKEPVDDINASAFEGCYGEVLDPWNKDLPAETITSTTMTNTVCINHCLSKGYKYAGTMNSKYCSCGNSRGRYGYSLGAGCNTTCAGNAAAKCGGPLYNSVYRTSAHPCTDTMLTDPLDPSVCYSLVLKKQRQKWATLDCVLQGGSLAAFKNPVTEEAIYNQLLFGSLWYANTVAAHTTAWIGLHYDNFNGQNNFVWNDGHHADWTVFGDSLSTADSKDVCAVTDIANKGGFDKQKCRSGNGPEAFYICQFNNTISAKIAGQSFQRYYSNKNLYQTVQRGTYKISSYLDYKCLNDRQLCPEGVTLSFFLKVNPAITNDVILSTGDCNTLFAGGEGFCIFYANSTLTILDVQPDTLKMANINILLDTWNHIVVFFEKFEIFVFVDGSFITQLATLGHLQNITRIIYDDVKLETGNNTEVKNTTFIAAPPDGFLLTDFDVGDGDPDPNKHLWTEFQPWGVNLSDWSATGIDGDGINLLSKSFIYETEQFNSICLSNFTICTSGFTFATWIKIPYKVKGNMQIFGYGGSVANSKWGMWLVYNGKSENLEILVILETIKYISQVVIETGQWRHLALTLDQASMKVYIQGQFVIEEFSVTHVPAAQVVALVSVSTAAPTTAPPIETTTFDWNTTFNSTLNFTEMSFEMTTAINNITIEYEIVNFTNPQLSTSAFFGSVICLPGWIQFGLSCYGVFNSYGNFWAHERFCQQFGAHMITIEESTEKDFIEAYLNNVGPYPVYLGIYDDYPYYSTKLGRRWMTVLGGYQNYIFFGDNLLAKNSGYNYVTMECDPTCNSEVNTNINRDVVLCELNYQKKKGRIEMADRCPSGWYFYNSNCYKILSTAVTGVNSILECSKQRAKLAEIKSLMEQHDLSNMVTSIVPQTVYIGVQLMLSKEGNYTYVLGDFRDVEFTHWLGDPLYDPLYSCVVMNCLDATCHWQNVSCNDVYKPLCQKPAELECAPGYRKFKDRCVSVVRGTNVETLCARVNTHPLTLASKAEMEEYLYFFPIDTVTTCLTDGIVDNGIYMWQSINSTTYLNYSGEVLTGSGQCISITSTGLVLSACTAMQCVICQYYASEGVGLDDTFAMDGKLSEAEIVNMSSKMGNISEVIMFNVESINGTNLDSKENINYISYIVDEGGVIRINHSYPHIIYPLNGSESCFSKLPECSMGITIQLRIFVVNATNCTVINTKSDGSVGIVVWVEASGSELHVRVTELNYEWYTFIEIVTQEWIFLTVTWQKNIGLNVYNNFRLVVSQKIRRRTWPFATSIVPSSAIQIGICESGSDVEYILLDDIIVRNVAVEDWVLAKDNTVMDTRSFYLDFNLLEDKSNTNLFGKIDNSTLSYLWRDSLFFSAGYINNIAGLTPALEFNQTKHCLTQTDLCAIPYTLSLWLQPRDMESDQIFLIAGTKTSSGLDSPSYKFWYDSHGDNYLFELYFDKTHFTVTFDIILYKWHHVVLVADLPNSIINMYVNGNPVTNITSRLWMERLIPRHHLSFLEIGGKGQFYLDDLQFHPKAMKVADLYALDSCHEYRIAGFRSIQSLYVTLENGTRVKELCDLDNEDISGHKLAMDKNNTYNSSITLDIPESANITYTQGVRAEAVQLNYTSMNVSGIPELCYDDVHKCLFGFTVALWVKVSELNPISNNTVLFEFGGDVLANVSGVTMDCYWLADIATDTKMDCRIVVMSNVTVWKIDFNMLMNRWYHLTVSWNYYKTLTLYINGHSTTKFGQHPVMFYVQNGTNGTDVSEELSPFVIGTSIHRSNGEGVISVDELFLLDRVMEDWEIIQIYGKTDICKDTWEYYKPTGQCYLYVDYEVKGYPDAEATCQSYGGNLVYIPDLATHQWLISMFGTLITPWSFARTALKQMPRAGHTIRWPDGSYLAYTPNNLNSYSSTTTRYGGYLPAAYSASTLFALDPMLTARTYICQSNPLYTMLESVRYKLNSVSLLSAPDEDYIFSGNLSYVRGMTMTSMLFNNTYIKRTLTDNCFVNIDYCHNGLSIQFWIYALDSLVSKSREMIYSTFSGPNSNGVSVYIYNNAGTYMLGVESRTGSNFTDMSVPVSVMVWSHVAVSINNLTSVLVYLNGVPTTFESVTFSVTDVAARGFGQPAECIVGTDFSELDSSLFIMDTFNITEIEVTHPVVLWNEVSPLFQDFILHMDEISQIRVPSTVKHTDGWLGNALFFDSIYSGPSAYKGQVAYDCQGAPDLCVDGFTFSLWLYPHPFASDHGIFSVINERSGFILKYVASTDLHYVLIRNYTASTSTVKNMEFGIKIQTEVWSYLVVSWFKNGTTVILINGIVPIVTPTITTSTLSGVAPVQMLEFGHVSSLYAALPAFQGGLDEYMFYPRPVDDNETFYMYKNVTYVKNDDIWQFENSPLNLTDTDIGIAMNTKGIVGNASMIQADVNWLNLSTSSNISSCLTDIDKCAHGFSWNFMFKFMLQNDTDQSIIGTIGNHTTGLGLSLMYTAMNKSLPFRRYFVATLLTSSTEYKCWFNLQHRAWTRLTITWHKRFGLRVFIDKVLASNDQSGAVRASAPTLFSQDFVIGRQQQTNPINEGLFAIDEMYFWDRATFEETDVMNETVFRHYLHTFEDWEDITVLTEVTRDECQGSCINSSCQTFMYCSEERFGTCHIVSSNASSTNVTRNSNPGCDLFTTLSIDMPVQAIGCLDIAHLGLLQVQSANFTTCLAECQPSRYEYYAVTGGLCYCGFHSDIFEYIAYYNDDTDSANGTCTELLMHQVTGIREVLNVTVPIVNFTVIVPGFAVGVNQTLELTFMTNEMSYAGFGIDAGDGSPMFYTQYNHSTVSYSQHGKYMLKVWALNEISWMFYTVEIEVQMFLSDMTFIVDPFVAIESNFSMSVNLLSGTNIFCAVTWDLNQTDVLFKSDASNAFNFTHSYPDEDTFVVNITCYNVIGSLSNQTVIRSVNPVRNLTIVTPETLAFGKDLNVSWVAEMGTNASFELFLDDVSMVNLTWPDLNISGIIQVPVELYQTVGYRELNLSANNIISGPEYSWASVDIQLEIQPFTVYFEKSHYRVNETIDFVIMFSNGSNLNYSTYSNGVLINEGNITGPMDTNNANVTKSLVISVPGTWSLLILAENSLSIQNATAIIEIEAVVDPLYVNVTDNGNPFVDTNITMILPAGYLEPTNALYNVNFGDGQSVYSVPLDINNGELVISHNYSVMGIYDISIHVYNNVSAIFINDTIQIGDRIANLTIVPNNIYIPLGFPVEVHFNKSTGTLVSYALDFGDGTNTTYSVENTYPDLPQPVSHTYAAIGIYPITVFAQNYFNNMTATKIVYVLEQISEIILTGDTLGRINYTMNFDLWIGNVGTNSCFLFDFKDGTFKLYGDITCSNLTEYAGIDFTPLDSNGIAVSHTYYSEGDYLVTVNSSNKVTYIVTSMNVKILISPCDYPTVDIYGFSQNVSLPTRIYLTSRITIPSVPSTLCLPPKHVAFRWCLIPWETNPVQICDYPSLSSLLINPYTLSYGLFEVNLNISIINHPIYSASSIAYIEVIPSPLVLDLVGDEMRTANSTDPLVIDASNSFDPDYPNDKNFSITWYCGYPGINVYDIDALDKNLLTRVGTGTCYPAEFSGTEEMTKLSIHIPQTIYGAKLVFVAEMLKGNRTKTRIQQVEILAGHELAIRCRSNCKDHVSANLPLKLSGICLTCTNPEIYSIPYTWRLFNVIGGNLGTEILNWDSWTTTGLGWPSLVIEELRLTPGQDYAVRLESGNAYTIKIIHIDFPSYNGNCYSNKASGIAFKTKFKFTCDGWLDEGFKKQRNLVIDSSFLEDFTFTFSYMVVGKNDSIFPFFKTTGRKVKVSGIVMGPGLAEFNYLVEIIVTVTDRFYSSTESKFYIQVYTSSDSPIELLTSLQMDTSKVEMDVSTLSLLCQSGTKMANDLWSNATTEDDTKVRVEVVDALFEDMDLLQDSVQVAAFTSTLTEITKTGPDNLPTSAKARITKMFKKLIEVTNSVMDSDEMILARRKIASGLLGNIIEYCQRTKYPLGCKGANCGAKFTEGEIAVDLIILAHNLTNLLLKGALPEEKGSFMEIVPGNTKYYIQRKQSVNLQKKWTSVQGKNVAYIPDFSSNLNPYVNTELDLEIIVSDNLYTTDDSVKSVKSRTVSVTLLDPENGVPFRFSNLEDPIKIDFQLQQSNDLFFTKANLTAKDGGPMFYLNLLLNETKLVPVVVLRPLVVFTNFTYYIRLNEVPDNKIYDFKSTVEINSCFNDTNCTSELILKLDMIPQYNINDTLYVGLQPVTANRLETPVADIMIYVLGCSYWHIQDEHWYHDGLNVGPVLDANKSVCLSTHLTTFGTNMFVPPNTIDFTTVWAKFANLGDNAVVFASCITVLGLYIIGLFFVRRADKKDIKKWAIYPLRDNVSTDVYHYHVTVYTGMRKGSGTRSKVYFVLGGEDGDTEIRELMDNSDRPLSTGSVNNYLLSVPDSLGKLVFLRIWHDNSGKLSDADWYLNMVLVKDTQTNQKYLFVCDQWLAIDKDDGEIERLIPVAGPKELDQFGHMFYTRTRRDVTDGHLWVSVLSRPTQSTFTRVQRLSCCCSLLFTTMITNAMWYRTTDDNPNQQNIRLGPFAFSSQEFFTSLMGSLIVVPVNLLIITLFKKSKPNISHDKTRGSRSSKRKKEKKKKKKTSKTDLNRPPSRSECVSPSHIDATFHTGNYLEMDESSDSQKTKRVVGEYPLPHWCRYVAYFLVLVSVSLSALFVILYSLEWGSEKSFQWFASFLFSFIESVLLIQPLKVIAVALVLILIFKKSNVSEEEGVEVYIMDEKTYNSDTYTEGIYPAHRQPYACSPPDPEGVEVARDYRKKMNKLFLITRELLTYMFYLVVVAIITYENRDTNSIYSHTNMKNIFVKPQSKYHKSFENLKSADALWNWLNDTVVQGLYPEELYNGSAIPADYDNLLSDHIHYKIGVPRLRQARVEPDGCTVHERMESVIPICYPEYNTRTYEGKNFSLGWEPYVNETHEAWIYKDNIDLNGLPIVGDYGSYSGGGYVAHFGNSRQDAISTIEYLKEHRWIDRQTRGVFMEFNLYNPNVNLFTIVSLLAEFPTSGGAVAYPQIFSLRLYRYNGDKALFLLILDIIFVAFTLYYVVGVLRKLKTEKCAFFKNFWNGIEFLNVSLSVIACAFYGMQNIMHKLTLDDLHTNRETFVNFQHVMLWDQLFGYMVAFLLFFSMLKLLRILRFNSKITQFAGMLKNMIEPLTSFSILLICSIIAFASFGYLVFGASNKEYASFISTLETLLSMLMMKMNIDSLVTVNNVLGSFYLFLFVLVIVFIQINMMVSIINDAFSQVREDPACLPDDPQMVDFILEQFKQAIFGITDNSTGKAGIPRKNKNNIDDEDYGFLKIHSKLVTFIDQNYKK